MDHNRKAVADMPLPQNERELRAVLPESLHPFVKNASITDNSGDSAKTFRLDGATRMFLKIGERGSLAGERTMTEYLCGKRLAPHVLHYASGESLDFLLTEALPGEAGSAAIHLADPKRLATVFGESLRLLHELPADDCPIRAKMPDGWNVEAESPVLIHGDYCLPNIILDRFAFSGFIDLGDAGLGDRHYDLYWGLWTLHYNLKNNQYHQRFLDAYGRDVINRDRLQRMSRFLAERM